MSPAAADIVVIPTCYRTELLAWCLRRLADAPGCPDVLICADTKANLQEVEYVRDQYFPTADILHAKAHISVLSGTWNILMSIKVGSTLADNVYLVEEDVMVFPHFFTWHRSQTAEASCGRKIPRYDLYTNPGSCLRRPLLEKLVPHINDDYFRDPGSYCERNFSQQFISYLDDGLIRRVIADNGMKWVFPETPVAAHQGFFGYGRYDITPMVGQTLEEKIANWPKMEETILTSPDPRYKRYCADFEPSFRGV